MINKSNPRQLLNPSFISAYFAQKITDPKYRAAIWNSVKITPVKKNFGLKNDSKFYHLIIRYDVPGLNQPVFCSAHSQENREPAYHALKFIHSQIKKYPLAPLFYSRGFNAFFYLGLNGENLQFYIKNKPNQVPKILKLTANRLANFHQIKINQKKHNFNPQNSLVETVVPGAKNFFKKINLKAPNFIPAAQGLFLQINEFDKKNFPKNGHYLIHGDFHPENIIINQNNPSKIAVIDYTDVCIADFARDLGNLIHQLNYMVIRFNPKLIKTLPKLQKIFLKTYLEKRKIKMSADLNQRINFYLAWAALRNAAFFLTKNFVETLEAQKSLQSAQKYLNSVKN